MGLTEFDTETLVASGRPAEAGRGKGVGPRADKKVTYDNCPKREEA